MQAPEEIQMNESKAMSPTGESTVDLGEFMDVVTTYKCKFCSFTCTEPQLMADHVKSTHLDPPVSTMSDVTTSVDTRDENSSPHEESGDALNTPPKLVNTIVQSSSVSNEIQTLVIPSQAAGLMSSSSTPFSSPTVSRSFSQSSTVFISDGASSITMAVPDQYVPEASVSVPQAAKQTNSLSQLDIQRSNTASISGDGAIQNSVMKYEPLSLSADESNNNQLDIEITEVNLNNVTEGTGGAIVMEESTCVSQMNNDIPSNVQTLDQAVKALMIPRSSLSESSPDAMKQTTTGINDQTLTDVTADYSNFVTREIFLCGQCNIGFSSIEECRVHMVQDHNINLPVNHERQATESVSIATQVGSLKKPGRKRKSEMIVKKPSKKPDSDEECLIQNINSTRSQRKRRTPKALKEDYFLGKKKRHKTKEKSKIIENYTLKCPVAGCIAKFKSSDSVDLHVKCHMEGEETFKCQDCGLIFPFWRLLRQHMWKDHTVDIDLFHCEKCNFKTDTPHKMTVHQEIHGSDRPYTCDICGKGFKQYSQMRNHQTTHAEYQSNDPSKWYNSKECDTCKKSFANQKCLIKHQEAVHSAIKPFVCPFCGYAAARKAMLMLHLRTHTGEKPFKCDICPYSSGDHNSLRRHKMRHTGQKPYKCGYCAYSCIQSVSLKTHLRNKHPGCDSMYLCNMCNYQSVNKANFEYHMNDHTNGLIPISKTKRMKTETASVQTMESQPVGVPMSDASQVEMQVQTLDTGEAQISADDLAKLTSYESFLSTELNAAQLIYSALTAISQNPETETSEGRVQTQSHILGGVQTTIISSAPKEGVTSHTITFHLPTSASSSSQSVLTEDAQPPLQVLYTNEIDIGVVQTRDNQLQIEEMQLSDHDHKQLNEGDKTIEETS